MDFSWVSALNDLVVIGGTVGGAIFAHKKGWFSLVVHVIEDKGAQIVQDVKNVAHGIGQLSPAAAAAEHALKQEVDQVSAHLRESRLVGEAAAALHALGQSLPTLSDDQKKAIVFDLASILPDATRKQIEDAIAAAQSKSDAKAASAIYVAANQFTAAQQEASVTATSEAAQ